MSGEPRGWGKEQKGKSTHGHGQQCGVAEGYIRGLNDNGKNTVKIVKKDIG